MQYVDYFMRNKCIFFKIKNSLSLSVCVAEELSQPMNLLTCQSQTINHRKPSLKHPLPLPTAYPPSLLWPPPPTEQNSSHYHHKKASLFLRVYKCTLTVHPRRLNKHETHTHSNKHNNNKNKHYWTSSTRKLRDTYLFNNHTELMIQFSHIFQKP